MTYPRRVVSKAGQEEGMGSGVSVKSLADTSSCSSVPARLRTEHSTPATPGLSNGEEAAG